MSIKKNILDLMLIFGLTGLIGCQPSNDSTAPAPPAAATGGVDGSGGNLATHEQASFTELVTKNHKYFVRDVVHRLFLIQKNSPHDFGLIKTLADRFLGPDETTLMKFINSIEYYTVSQSCPSTDHPSSDGSALASGKICFSYEAFKRMPEESLESKLLVLTLHEISHLRGFNEKEAVEWQSAFNYYPFAKMVILTNNEKYEVFKKNLRHAIYWTDIAFRNLISKNIEAKKEDYCSQIGKAEDKSIDLTADLAEAQLPAYLSDFYFKNIFTPLASIDCESQTQNKVAESIAKILEDSINLQKAFENYETPVCTNDVCAFRRSFDNFFNPELSLTYWKARKNSFLNQRSYALMEAKKIKCTITDQSTQKNTELFQTDENNIINKERDMKEFDEALSFLSIDLNWLDESKNTNTFKTFKDSLITLYHWGPLQIIESQGFSAESHSIAGTLGSETPNGKIYVRFAIMDAQPVIDKNLGRSSNNYFTIRNTLKETIQEIPPILKEFELSCSLN